VDATLFGLCRCDLDESPGARLYAIGAEFFPEALSSIRMRGAVWPSRALCRGKAARWSGLRSVAATKLRAIPAMPEWLTETCH